MSSNPAVQPSPPATVVKKETPRFLLLKDKEYVFVPIPNANVTFKNNVKVTDIDYPWVEVKHVPQAGETEQPAPVWINMDQVVVVKVV